MFFFLFYSLVTSTVSSVSCLCYQNETIPMHFIIHGSIAKSLHITRFVYKFMYCIQIYILLCMTYLWTLISSKLSLSAFMDFTFPLAFPTFLIEWVESFVLLFIWFWLTFSSLCLMHDSAGVLPFFAFWLIRIPTQGCLYKYFNGNRLLRRF